ncbi:unnamed protein product [Coregonus sp. 'balchen']|nr:unnamed protein product [Coregonus sp. 'balchen']
MSTVVSAPNSLQMAGREAVPVALGRGLKPAPTNRSRQRERALQLAAPQKSGPGSLVQPPEEELTKTIIGGRRLA